MKYIVKIKPEYKDSFKGLMILGAKDNDLFVDVLAVDDIELLNSDYINEHFADLQDTAYQKGFEDGKAVHEKGCKGCRWEGVDESAPPCYNCCNAHPSHWEAKPQVDDKIVIGDEVKWGYDCFVVTRIYKPLVDKRCNGIAKDGSVYMDVVCNRLTKTGRHFNIDKILEEMRHD